MSFLFVLFCTKKRCSQIKPQLKVIVKEGHKAPLKPSKLKKLYPKAFNFQLLKTHEKIYKYPGTFFLFVLSCTKRRC